MTDDLAVFLPLFIYGLAAALVGYLVGTWPRKRQPVETIDRIMMGLPPESTPAQKAATNAALRVQQQIWDRTAAEAQTLANALTESPDAGRASPGAEAAATDASVPVEKGRPDQETGGPAASDVAREDTERAANFRGVGQSITNAELNESIEQERLALLAREAEERDFTAGVPRVPCATPLITPPLYPQPDGTYEIVARELDKSREEDDALSPEARRITDMINNMTPPPAWPKTEEEAVTARATLSKMIEEGYAIGDAIRDAYGLPRFPHAPKTPHIDQHAPGFAARARKAKAKKGKK